MAFNSTSAGGHMDLGKPQSQARAWFEPVLVVTVMIVSLIVNRLRSYNIFHGRSRSRVGSPHSDDHEFDYREGRSFLERDNAEKLYARRSQNVCGIPVPMPDTSVFADRIHSRILQKFPFIVEMFYWALNYVAYSLTKKTANWLYQSTDTNAVTQLAQDHGIDILNFEHESIFSIFFPIKEVDLQSFILSNHQSIMTFFNQIYSLVHIPGTVMFLSWYYYAAPDHEVFAIARRTMTLGNFAAFLIFTFYPCMPPRLLPAEWGFQDTVRQEHAESVWVGGANVNQLAAMPSLHFTYAFVIGCTFIYHSGYIQMLQGKAPRQPWATTSVLSLLAGVLYPLLVLSVIVATANHYWLDAVVAMFSVTICFFCNNIWSALLPLEACFLWVCRVEKPIPTTGLLKRKIRGRGGQQTYMLV